MDPKIETVLISATFSVVVALITFVATFVTTRVQVRSKIDELTQAQLKDILAKRIAVYPQLWSIVQTNLSDFERTLKLTSPSWSPTEGWAPNADWTRNADWARNLLKQLIEWHQQNGVFLSEGTYKAFAALRNRAASLVRMCNVEQYHPTIEDFHELDKIYYDGYYEKDFKGKDVYKLPLATQLKNDLGSYKLIFVRV